MARPQPGMPAGATLARLRDTWGCRFPARAGAARRPVWTAGQSAVFWQQIRMLTRRVPFCVIFGTCSPSGFPTFLLVGRPACLTEPVLPVLAVRSLSVPYTCHRHRPILSPGGPAALCAAVSCCPVPLCPVPCALCRAVAPITQKSPLPGDTSSPGSGPGSRLCKRPADFPPGAGAPGTVSFAASGVFGQCGAHLLHGLCLDLANALGRHAILVGQILQRTCASLVLVTQPARFDDVAAAVV